MDDIYVCPSIHPHSSCLLRASIVSKHFFIITTDAHNYKIIGVLKTIKIPTIAPKCFGSRRNHHQGAISCLAKTTIMILLCSSLMTWSMLWRHISLLFKREIARLNNRLVCRHNIDCVYTDEHNRTIIVVLAKHEIAPWWWFLREPKHVGAIVGILIVLIFLWFCNCVHQFGITNSALKQTLVVV